MKVITLPTFGHWSNSYLAISDSEAALVDPSASPSHVADALEENGCALKYILLTHGHYDHTRYVTQIAEKTHAEICIHRADDELLGDSEKNCYTLFNSGEQIAPGADILLEDGDELRLGFDTVRVMHTPGHTRGSVCYLIGSSMFSGDTLFRGSVGRTDFYGGDSGELYTSLLRLKMLDGEYEIYPGHEGTTTLNIERKFNRYLRNLNEI